MALVLNDRVKETTTSTGTGTINLAGAETGFETFVAGVGNSNTCYYCIAHQSADEFEVGLGTVTDATPDTLSRTTIISSSNSDSAVNFSAGTKDVFCTLPASKAVFEDGSGNLEIDVSGIINLDADNGGNINLKDGGTLYATLQKENNDLRIISIVQDGDIIFRGNDGGSYVNALTLDMSDSGSATFNSHITINNTGADRKLAINRTGGKNFSIEHDTSGFYIYNITDASLHTKFTNDGKIGIGTNVPGTDGYSFAEDLVIKAGASADDGAGLSIQSDTRRYGVIAFGDSANDNEGEIWYDHQVNSFNMRTANVQRFQLDSSGNATFTGNVTAYGSISDERLKENIKVIENPIEKIKDLKGVTFTYKKDGEKSTGLIAQDLEKVLPEAVYTSETIADEREGEESEEHLAIRYGNTVGLLVEAIKELEARVKELEAK